MTKPKGGARPGAGRPVSSLDKLGIDGRIAARRHAEKAMKTIVDLLTSPQHSVRLGAATQILDRAWGRPAQAVDVSGEVDHNHIHNDAERFTSAIASLIARESEGRSSQATEH